MKNSIFMKVLEDGRLVNRALSDSVQDWLMKVLLYAMLRNLAFILSVVANHERFKLKSDMIIFLF